MALQTLRVRDSLVTPSVLRLDLDVVFRTTSALELTSLGKSMIKKKMLVVER